MKARRKPLLFDYIQFHPSNRQQVCNLVGHDGTGEHHECPVTIKTLEGNVYANVGDFIMTGVNGEHWPVKPDVFEKSYDIVEEPGNETTPACDVAKATPEQIADKIIESATFTENEYGYLVVKSHDALNDRIVQALADARREGEEATEGWEILKRLTRGGLHEVTFEGCGDAGVAVYRRPLILPEGEKTIGGLYKGGHLEGLRDILSKYLAALLSAKEPRP